MVYLLAFAMTVGLVGLLLPVAHAVGLIDHPRGHRSHPNPTPLVGGLAMGLCCVVLYARLHGATAEPLAAYLWASLLVLAQGAVDDRHSLGPWLRLSGQLVAASVVVLGGGIRIDSLGNLLGFGAIHLGLAAVPFTLFTIVGLINAFNMIDGADGLAGSMILVTGLLLLVASWWSGYTALVPEVMILIASTVGFLAWNLRLPGRRHARVFLGDAGSTWAGFTLACLTILVTQRSAQVLSPMVAIWVLAVPVFDAVSLMLHRWSAGRSAFEADNAHLHHVLVARGMSVNAAVGIIVCLAAGLGLLGLWLDRLQIPEIVSTMLAVAAFVLFHRVTRQLIARPPRASTQGR